MAHDRVRCVHAELRIWEKSPGLLRREYGMSCSGLPAGFERFWTSYPRKVGKLDALRAWKKLKPDETLVEHMIESIDEHRRCKAWRDGFICHPATFLRQGRWMDELGYDDFHHAKL